MRSASSSSSYDHCTAWRSVWWRSSPRRDPTSSRNRLSRRSRISVTDIESSREAANSIASGIPSSRWQISTTASSSSTGETPRATAHARSTNSDAAAESGPVRTSRGGTGQSNSSLIRNPSRLVARILTVSERAKIESITSAAASNTCSQLSKHQQPPTRLQRRGYALGHTQSRLLGNAEDCSHGLRYRGRIAHGGKFDDPHSVWEAVRRAGRPIPVRVESCRPPRHRSTSPTDAPSAPFPGRPVQPRGRRSSWSAAEGSLASRRRVCNGGKSVRRPSALHLKQVDRFGDIA